MNDAFDEAFSWSAIDSTCFTRCKSSILSFVKDVGSKSSSRFRMSERSTGVPTR